MIIKLDDTKTMNIGKGAFLVFGLWCLFAFLCGLLGFKPELWVRAVLWAVTIFLIQYNVDINGKSLWEAFNTKEDDEPVRK